MPNEPSLYQGCKLGLVKKSETLVYARSTWVYNYMIGVVACAWRVKSGTGSQKSDQIILSILKSSIILNDEIIIYALALIGFFFIRENIEVIF